MTIKTTWEGLKAKWSALSPRNKLLVGGGAVVLLVLAAGSQNGAQRGPGGYAPPAYANGGYPNAPYPNGGYPNGGYPNGPNQGGYPNGPNPGGYANAPQGAPYPAGAYATGGTAPGPGAQDADPTGYWARQRSQDQSAQAFSGYIRDTTTVRDTGDGTVYTDVPNAAADPAIASGAATAVPTAELPTTYDAPAAPSE